MIYESETSDFNETIVSPLRLFQKRRAINHIFIFAVAENEAWYDMMIEPRELDIDKISVTVHINIYCNRIMLTELYSFDHYNVW